MAIHRIVTVFSSFLWHKGVIELIPAFVASAVILPAHKITHSPGLCMQASQGYLGG